MRAAMVKREPVRCEVVNYSKNGRESWVEIDIAPVLDDSGKLTHFVSIQRDITERKRIEEALRQSEEHFRQAAAFNQKLVHEVNHRVRNNLSALMSLISMSRKRATDIATFAASIETRVRSLSQVHNLMSSSGGKDMELRAIVNNLNASVSQLASHSITTLIDGPSIWLDPIQILPLAFSLVELFNNAIAHGAFKSESGILEILWTVRREEAGSLVSIHWKEVGIPPIKLPVTPNLGMKLVDGFVNYDLGGRCSLNYTEASVNHTIEFVVPKSNKSNRPSSSKPSNRG
jgi:two-component sensor histidine kinase